MNTGSHLNKDVIEEYRTGRLDGAEHRAIERHLLICMECLRKMPEPTADEMWAAVMTENVALNSASVGGSFTVDLFQSVIARPAFASLFLILFLLLGLSAFLLLDRSWHPGNPEIARYSEMEPLVLDPKVRASSANSNEGESDTDILNDLASTNSKNADAPPLKTPSKVKRHLPKGSGPHSKTTASETRGSGIACGDPTSLSGSVKRTENGIELSWGKVHDAVKYRVYVADLDERLVDDFETNDKASYVLNTKLDQDITYRWTLLVSLEGGRSVTGAMQTFNSEGRAASTNKTTTAKVRCAQANEKND